MADYNIFGIHPGSWTIPGTNIRIPDIGLTERISDYYKQSRNPQGGSQLRQGTVFNVGNVPYTYSNTPVRISPTTTYIPGSGGGYYKTTISSQQNQQQQQSQPQQQNQQQQQSQQQEDPMERIKREVEGIYTPLMDYYNQAETSITSEYERYKPELEQQYATSLSKLQTEKERGERELQTQQEAALQRREDALSAARRLYSELRRGGLQRFGGASSAGQAFTELTNVEQQRQAGNIWNLYQQAENQITKYKANLIDQFNQGQKELELAKTSAINQAYSDYQNRLNQIRAMKAQTQSAKAQMALEALYTLRNQVNQINLANLNLAQQLAAQKELALNYVNSYAQKVANSIMGGRGTYASFEQQTTTSPTSQMTIGGKQAGVVTPYQGQISRRPEEDYLYGY